jgi:capsule biosynthesis phosphatase
MRIAIDLDGTICEIREDPKTYEEVQPLPDAVAKIRELKQAGHYIIILTARHMKTCDGNLGLVVAEVAKTTLDWLAKHQVPFDEIHFGKPNADVYIDDRAVRFTSWESLSPEILESVAKPK